MKLTAKKRWFGCQFEGDLSRLLKFINIRARGNPKSGIELNEATIGGGFDSVEEARIAATILGHRELLLLEDGKDGRLYITPAGVDQANRLEMPFWRRWASNETVVMSVVASILVLILGKVIDLLAQALMK